MSEHKGHLQSGAEILVQCLINHGVDVIFAYPGGASMPLHQALTRVSDKLRTILPRHEQGGAFAAEGGNKSKTRRRQRQGRQGRQGRQSKRNKMQRKNKYSRRRRSSKSKSK